MCKCVLMFTLCLMSNSTVLGQVYNVVPVDLGEAYSIAPGSTMTAVDGEISDWLITVEGEHRFIFRPTTDVSDRVSFDNLVVTEDDIRIDLSVDGAGASLRDIYRSLDGCEAEDYCRATLAWSRGFNPVTNEFTQAVSFRHSGISTANGSNPDGPDPDDYVFNVLASQPLPLGTTVIAVASQSAPEPTAGYLVSIGLLCATGLARKRSR